VNLASDLGGVTPNWGYAESVLIDGPWVVCTPGGPHSTMIALDKLTGQLIWRAAIGDGAAYASIVKAEIAGVPQYVQFTAAGVIGVRAADGKLLWRYDAPSSPANCATVVVNGDMVFAASGYGIGGGLVRVVARGDQMTAEEVYFTKKMKNHHGGLILIGKHLYGANDPGLLTCLEFETGEQAWADRSCGKCSLLYVDGKLIVRSEEGQISLVEATPQAFRLKGRFDQPNRSDQASWPHPVVVNGRLYLRDQDQLFCFDVRGDAPKD
jgi:outer membrane protein assembly factor BamB